jgi:hypothetical protein
VNPVAGYGAQRWCHVCKMQSKVHITLEQWVVLVTCESCNACYELERFERY